MDTRPDTQRSTALEERPTRPTPWNVVLVDDDEHTYEYVIRVLQELFHWDREKAFKVAKRVDEDGRAVLVTTHKELAELRAEQVASFGRDPLIRACRGGMTCVIEPAEFGDDAQNESDEGSQGEPSREEASEGTSGGSPSQTEQD
jgi:ATP-dependent Clp protease adaptor protein ClpS